MKVAVLGAGNGGLAIGSHMALKGCQVSIYDKFPQALEGIRQKGGVELKGPSSEGFARFERITSDIEEAIEGASLIMVVTPAFAHRELAEKCAPFLDKGQQVLLNPGRTGGAIEFYEVMTDVNKNANALIGEAQTLIYACRITGPGEVTIFKEKESLSIATIPACRTEEMLESLRPLYPQVVAAQSVLETSLLNIGAIFHPVPALLNIARIENKASFEYYMEGITPCVSNLLENVDRERVAIGKAFGVRTMTVKEWLESSYDVKYVESDSIYDSVQRQAGYRGIEGPSNPYCRYITEDVPMSIVPIAELGKVAGVPTPVIDTVIKLADSLHNEDYRSHGRNLKKLGFADMTMQQIKEFTESGRASAKPSLQGSKG